jgi:hypothetical protein
MLAVATAMVVVPLVVLASDATLSVSPATASGGDRIRIIGAGFPPGESGVITWDGDPTATKYRVNGAGQFKVSFRAPTDAASGPHTLGAVAGDTLMAGAQLIVAT